jgi:DNA repair exonuclease SbcCD nuclease subunit
MFEFVVSSDWHLGKIARFFPNDHIERQIIELHKPFKYAIEHGIKTIVIPGDISDTPHIEERVMKALINLIFEYDGHLRIIYIAGNHDFEDINTTSMDLLETLQSKAFKSFEIYLKPAQITIEGIVCNMLPFPMNRAIKNDKPCLNFAHIERTGALMDNGKPSRRKNEHDFKCKKEDYTVSGHLHTYQELKNQRTLFVGAAMQVKFDDTPKKGFSHVKARYKNGALKVVHKFIPSKPNFLLKRLVVESIADWSIVENDKLSIYEIRLGEGVVLPNNIREKCPNIFSVLGHKLEQTTEELIESASTQKHMPRYSPTQGLSKYLKRAGLKKNSRLLARSYVEHEMSRLGIS